MTKSSSNFKKSGAKKHHFNVAIDYESLLKKFDAYGIKRTFDLPFNLEISGKTPQKTLIYNKVYIYTFFIMNLNYPDSKEVRTVLINKKNIFEEYKRINKEFNTYVNMLKNKGENVNYGKVRKKFYELINVYVPGFESDENISNGDIKSFFITAIKKESDFGISKVLNSLFSEDEITKHLKNYLLLHMNSSTKQIINKPSSFTYKALKIINSMMSKPIIHSSLKAENSENIFKSFKEFEKLLIDVYKKTFKEVYVKYNEASMYLDTDLSNFYFLFSFIGERKNEGTFIHLDGKAKELAIPGDDKNKSKNQLETLYDFYYRGYSYVLV